MEKIIKINKKYIKKIVGIITGTINANNSKERINASLNLPIFVSS